jgi:hypothetical protein
MHGREYLNLVKNIKVLFTAETQRRRGKQFDGEKIKVIFTGFH